MSKNKYVSLHVNECEKQNIQHRAKELGVTVSQYLRGLVEKDMKNHQNQTM